VCWTYEAGEVVVESIDERESLKYTEQLVVVDLAWVCLNELIQTVLTSLVRVYNNNNNNDKHR